MDLVIRGLFICEFKYSHFKNWFNVSNFWSKCVFLSANSVFPVRNGGTYLSRITGLACNCLHQRFLRLIFSNRSFQNCFRNFYLSMLPFPERGFKSKDNLGGSRVAGSSNGISLLSAQPWSKKVSKKFQINFNHHFNIFHPIIVIIEHGQKF